MGVLNTIQRWLLLLAVFFVPIFFLPTTQEFFITNKSYLLLFATIIVLVLIGIQVLLSRKIHVVQSAFGRILLAFIIIRGVTVFFATPNRIQALYSLPLGMIVFVGLTFLYLLVVHIAGTQRHKIPVLQALSFGTVLASAIVIIFYFKPLQGTNLPPQLGFLQNDLFSPVGNALDTLLLLGFTIVMFGSNIVSTIKENATKLLPKQLALSLIVVVAFGMITAVLLKPAEGTPKIQLPPLSISWFAALETLKTPKTALLGTGVGNFDSVFTLVKPTSYNATDLWQVNFALARSSVLHVWVESGLIGLIAVLLLIVYVVRELNGLMQHKDDEATLYIMMGIYVALVLFLLPPSFISLFIMFAYLAALAQKSMAYEHDTVKEFDAKSFAPVYVGVVILLVGVASGIGYYASQAYASELYFKKSIDAIQENKGQEVYANLQEAIRRQPQKERFRAQFAQINLLLANNLARQEELSDQDRQAIAQFIQQAIAEGKALVALNPNKAANWNTLAVIYRNIINVAQGADAWTVASYQEAIRRDPQNPQLALNLGGVYYAAQNYPAAIQNFQRAVSLKPDWANAHYNLAWALFQNGDAQGAVAVMNNVVQLIDPSSEDYTKAQENLVAFSEEIPDEASNSGTLEDVQSTGTEQPPLALPEQQQPVISPPIELSGDAGPDETIEAAPTPADTETDGAKAKTGVTPTVTPVQ